MTPTAVAVGACVRPAAFCAAAAPVTLAHTGATVAYEVPADGR